MSDTHGSAEAAAKAAGLAVIAALEAYWFLQPVPFPFKALVALLVVIAVARPAAGLLVFAGLAPLSTVIADLCGASGMGAPLLKQAALGIGAGALLWGGLRNDRTRIGPPAMLLATVGAASAAVAILVVTEPFSRTLGYARGLFEELLFRQTGRVSPVWGPLLAAVTLAECGLLGWSVERTVRRTPALGARLLLIALIGHAGAAALNLQTVASRAMRSGDMVHALPRLLMTTRVSWQTDWNAAASALLLAGIAGLALASGSRRRRAGVGLALAVVAGGVWVTGSRAAIAIGLGAIAVAVAWRAAGAGRLGRVAAAGLALAVLGVGAWAIVGNPSGRNDPISRSITVREVMFETGVRLFAEAPVFGIGLTRFYGESERYAGPALTGMGWRPTENAHNNFIQVLAEQGLVGFAALLWWLAVILTGGVRAQISNPDAGRKGLLLAVVACVGTWLTGHPLIVPEFAFVFWLYCGILTAMTPGAPATRARWLPWVLAAGVLVSMPFRAMG